MASKLYMKSETYDAADYELSAEDLRAKAKAHWAEKLEEGRRMAEGQTPGARKLASPVKTTTVDSP